MAYANIPKILPLLNILPSTGAGGQFDTDHGPPYWRGSRAVLRCKENYKHPENTVSTVVEMADELVWVPRRIDCIPLPGLTALPKTGAGGRFVSYRYPPYLFGNAAHLECDNGYEPPVNITSTVGQENDALFWSPSEINCEPVQCPPPDVPLHGSVSDAHFHFPKRFRYVCDEGYRLNRPSEEHECSASGLWNPPVPSNVRCEPVECPRPPAPEHGSVSLTQLYFGSVATFRCDDNYRMVRGQRKRKCLADGTWSGQDVVCDRIPPPPPTNPAADKSLNGNSNNPQAIPKPPKSTDPVTNIVRVEPPPKPVIVENRSTGVSDVNVSQPSAKPAVDKPPDAQRPSDKVPEILRPAVGKPPDAERPLKPNVPKLSSKEPDESKFSNVVPDASNNVPDESKPPKNVPDAPKPSNNVPDATKPPNNVLDAHKPPNVKPAVREPPTDASKPSNKMPDESKPSNNIPDESKPPDNVLDAHKPPNVIPDAREPPTDASKPLNKVSDESKPSNTIPDEPKPPPKPDAREPPTNVPKPPNNVIDASKPSNKVPDAPKPSNHIPDESKPPNNVLDGHKPPNVIPDAHEPPTDASKPPNNVIDASKPSNKVPDESKPSNNELDAPKPQNNIYETSKLPNNIPETSKLPNNVLDESKPFILNKIYNVIKPSLTTQPDASKPSLTTKPDASKPSLTTQPDAPKPSLLKPTVFPSVSLSSSASETTSPSDTTIPTVFSSQSPIHCPSAVAATYPSPIPFFFFRILVIICICTVILGFTRQIRCSMANNNT